MKRIIAIVIFLLILGSEGYSQRSMDTIVFVKGGKLYQLITYGDDDSITINRIKFYFGRVDTTGWNLAKKDDLLKYSTTDSTLWQRLIYPGKPFGRYFMRYPYDTMFLSSRMSSSGFMGIHPKNYSATSDGRKNMVQLNLASTAAGGVGVGVHQQSGGLYSGDTIDVALTIGNRGFSYQPPLAFSSVMINDHYELEEDGIHFLFKKYSSIYGVDSTIYTQYQFKESGIVATSHNEAWGYYKHPDFGSSSYPFGTGYFDHLYINGSLISSFPGFGTSHDAASYGDHNHSGVYQPAGSYLTGSGTSNYIPKWSSSSGLGNSLLYDNGSFIGMGATAPLSSEKFRIDAGNGPGLVVQNASTGYGEPAFAAYSTGAGPANGIAIYASCGGSLVNYALWAENGILYSKDGAKMGSGNKDSLFTCNGSAHFTGNVRIDGNTSVKKLNSDSAIVSGLKANGNSSTAINIYASQGNTQTVTRTGNCTYSLVGMAAGQKLTLVMVHEASATAYTVAFSPTILWAGGVTPTYTNTSGAVDVVSIVYDGTRYLGMQTADFK